MRRTGDLFPFDDVRPVQEEFIGSVKTALEDGKNLIAHAPTGLGKTVASLAPAIEYALETNKVIFFLTSRHTQHRIAIETMDLIKEKKNVQFNVVDFIGKRSMCLVPGVQSLGSAEFLEYCRTVSRKDYTCEYYVNTRKQGGQSTVKAQEAMMNARNMDLDSLMSFCTREKLCPYEISMLLAEKARVVVCDYNYIFNDSIRQLILGKMDRTLSECIVIIDEGHNLPFRIRDLMTSRTTQNVLERASKEAQKYGYGDLAEELGRISESFSLLGGSIEGDGERRATKEEFSSIVEEHAGNIDRFIEDLEDASDKIREEQKQSFVGSFGMFLKEWVRDEDGFARIMNKREATNGYNLTLSYRCLDPAVVSRDIVNSTHSSILMSGTLIPVEMYRDLLEIKDPLVKVFPSPFPEKNRLNLLVPDVTTKFTQRGERQFQKIARICATITNNVPGNSAIFFPSYSLRDKVNFYLRIESNKSQLVEESGMTQEEKNEMIEKLEGYKDTGIILLGASSGSFGEGVDFPGDLLKCVIIVGLPLRTPDLETKETIEYFDRKFAKGWNYGYIFPAFNLTLQNAGRCIRSETDKGIVVFLDERYSWAQYSRCFPEDVRPKVPEDFEKEVLSFFNGGLQQTLVEETDLDDLDSF